MNLVLRSSFFFFLQHNYNISLAISLLQFIIQHYPYITSGPNTEPSKYYVTFQFKF